MNENFELENMRQQMNTLKKKLEQQEIVNERMIHKSMKRTTSNIMRRYYAIMALCLLMIPYTYVVFIMSESLSMNFWIGTTILMLICGGATYYNSLNVSKSDMMSGNLVEVGHHMARAKKFDANWLFFGIPAVSQKYSDATQYMIYGIVCGAVIGAICGINTHLKTQRQYQEVIDQIEDLTRE